MSTRLFAATVSMLALMAAGAANAHDTATHNWGDNAAIQKGGSASMKAYGYNKQGDHYNTNNVREPRDDRYVYPGQRVTYGTKSDLVIQKGGSAISDTTVNAQADMRPYGTYWR